MDLSHAAHDFTLRQLQYAVAVADTLSFRRAAERCHVSQPSLSAQLAQLEDVLGVRLFERDRKRVLLTSAGKDLIERARKLLLATADFVNAAKRVSDPLAGTMRIGVIPTISPYFLPFAAPKLRARFAHLAFAWHEDHTGHLMASLAVGALDAALVALEANVGDVEREVIAIDPFVLALRPEHPLAKKTTPASIAELRGTDVLLLDEGHCFREQALEVCTTARAHEVEFRATSLATLVQMVVGGAGVTLLPQLAVATEAKRARLKIRPLSVAGANRTIALVWRKGTAVGDAMRAIAAVMRDAYPS